MTTTLTTAFDDGSVFPIDAIYGDRTVHFTHTIDASAEITTAYDVIKLFELPNDSYVYEVYYDIADLDGGTAADLDIVLVCDGGSTDESTNFGSDFATVKQIVATGSLGQAAATGTVKLNGFKAHTDTGRPYFALLVQTPPGTDQDGALTLHCTYNQCGGA